MKTSGPRGPASPHFYLVHPGENTLELLDKLRSQDPAPPSTHFPAVDADLETICLKCLSREPEKRYESAAALADDLERWLRGEAILARPVTDWERAVKWVRRRPVPSALAALLITAIGLGLGTTLWQLRRAERAVATRQLQLARGSLDQGQTGRALIGLADLVRKAPHYRPAGTLLLSALQERTFAWPVAGPYDHAAEISRVSFAPDGRSIATAGADGVARVWAAIDHPLAAGAAAASNKPLLLAHGSWVRQVVYSLNGKHVATCGEDRFAKVWELSSGQLLRTVEHAAQVTSVAFSPDGKYVATTSLDRIARITEVATGASVIDLVGHTNAVGGASFSPDNRFLFTVADDLRGWDWRSGQPLWDPIHPPSPFSTVGLGPRGDRLVFGCMDGTVSVREFRTGRELFQLPKHSDVVRALDLSGDGLRLLTADEVAVRVWDAHTGRLLSPELKHVRRVTEARFSPDGAYLATACEDGFVRVWDAVTYQPACEPINTGYFTYSLAFSPDGQRLATASGKGTAAVWDIRPGKAQPTELAAAPMVYGFKFASAGSRVLAAAANGTVQRLDASDGQPLATWRHTNHVGTRFSPDGRAFVTAATNGVARVWSAEDGGPVTPALPHPAPLFAPASVFDLQGRRLFTALDNPVSVFVWEIPSGRLLASREITRTNFGFANTRILQAEFTPEGQGVVMGSDDGRVLVWDYGQGNPERTLLKYNGGVYSLCFSPDGRRLAVASLDRTGSLVEWPSGRVLATFRHEGELAFTSVSPDSRKVVTTSLDYTARVWDGLSGRSILSPLTHAGTVGTARFSPDGDRLATACWDGRVMVWELGIGQPLTAPLEHTNRVDDVQFSPDGQRLLTRYKWGPPRLWDVPALDGPTPQWLAELAEAIAGQRLGRDGWPVPVGLETWVRLGRSLAASTSTDRASRWARWFASDRGDRTVSFLSGIRVSDLLRARLEENTLDSLQQAVRLNPTNATALARLAQRFLQQPPDSQPHRLERADFYSDRAMEFDASLPEVRAVRAEIEAELAKAGLPTVRVVR